MRSQQKKKSKSTKGNQQAGRSVAAPVAYAAMQQFPGPQRNRSRRIQNSELVMSINGTTAFGSTQLPVNPGMAITFPWLSLTAAQWQQYHFHKLCFRYVTRTATAEKGSIILSPDYNPTDPAPLTEAQASNTQDAREDVCWRDLPCPLDVKSMYPFGDRKLIRLGNRAGDPNLYDSANMFICTIGEDDTAEIGKLWVDYDVELFVPQNSPNTSSASQLASEYTQSAAQTITTATATTLLWDAALQDPLAIGAAAVGTFTPRAGTYLVTWHGTFADSAAENFTVQSSFQVNSAVLPSPVLASQGPVLVGAGGFLSTSLEAIVELNGTDTFKVRTTLTGAAGTLTQVATSSRLVWRAV